MIPGSSGGFCRWSRNTRWELRSNFNAFTDDGMRPTPKFSLLQYPFNSKFTTPQGITPRISSSICNSNFTRLGYPGSTVQWSEPTCNSAKLSGNTPGSKEQNKPVGGVSVSKTPGLIDSLKSPPSSPALVNELATNAATKENDKGHVTSTRAVLQERLFDAIPVWAVHTCERSHCRWQRWKCTRIRALKLTVTPLC